MRVYLVHHGEAVAPDLDPQRPLSPAGRASVERIAADAAARGARPDVVWHSGKLRTRQTAEIYWRACNPLAEFTAVRDLQPADPAVFMRDRLRHETRDVMLVGHLPHLPELFALLVAGPSGSIGEFPLNGLVRLRSDDDGES